MTSISFLCWFGAFLPITRNQHTRTCHTYTYLLISPTDDSRIGCPITANQSRDRKRTAAGAKSGSAITRTFSKMSCLTFSHFQIDRATNGTIRVSPTKLSPGRAAAPVDKDMRKLQIIVNRVAGDQRTALVSMHSVAFLVGLLCKHTMHILGC